MTLQIGTLTRPHLVDELDRAGVQLNASAQTLLEDPVFDHEASVSIDLVERAVNELGLPHGAPLPRILGAARDLGLHPCPATTGPYLRLAWLTQPNAPDTILSSGRAPTGSLTVAAAPLQPQPSYPKGFYLRVIDHVPWLRGYHCDLSHPWDPDDRFIFAMSDPLT